MAGVAFEGVNGGSSCATLNSVGPGIDCQSVRLTHPLGCLDGLGWLEDLEFLFFSSVPRSAFGVAPGCGQGLTLS